MKEHKGNAEYTQQSEGKSTGADLNIVIISGTLDSDPKVNFTKNDNKAVSFSLAVGRAVNTDQGVKTYTSWFNIASFNSAVIETVEKLNKGDRVALQGPLNVRSWVDSASGQKRLRYEIMAERVNVIGAIGHAGGSFGDADVEGDIPDEIFS